MDGEICALAPANWQIRSIEEVCKRVTSGGTPSRTRPEYFINGVWPWVKTQELNDTWIEQTEEKITDEAVSNSSAKILPPNTILLAMYGATIGQLGILRTPMTCNQACCAMIVDSKIADFHYLYYQLSNSRTQLKSLGNGAAQQNLSGALIKSLRYPFPPLPVQRRIASILGSLDDKIELNRQMNETLEAMAKALFQSWFVDFDPVHAKAQGNKPEGMNEATAALFPDSFEESDLGMIPKGWSVKSLDVLMDIQGGTQPPASEFLSAPAEGYLRLVQIRDYESDSHLTYVLDTSKLRKCRRDDVMIARYGASVARVCWGLEGAYNVALVKAAPTKLFYREFIRTYLQTHSFQARLIGMSNRSAQAGFNKGDIASFQITTPPDKLLEKYQATAWELRRCILYNGDKSRTLATLRDTLLPKLLSGEISTERANEQIGEALHA